MENELPLERFFYALRQNNFDLGIKEYYALLEALHSGFRLDDEQAPFAKENLKFLCQTLWLKPNQSLYEFEALFEENFSPFSLPKEQASEPEEVEELSEGKTTPQVEKEKTNPVPEIAQPEPTQTQQESTSTQKEEFRIKFELSGNSSQNKPSTISDEAQLERSFLFTENYFNITQRQFKQAVRFLPILRSSVPSQEIAFKATIKGWAKKGFFERLIYKPQQTLYNSVLLLRDNKGSMQVFEPLGDMLSLALREAFGGKKGSFEEYFFYNVPQGYFYHDKIHTEAKATSVLLPEISKRKALVIIFSDAGAARGGNSDGRFKKTLRFVLQMQKVAQHLVWLNPMPQSRWEGTTAQRIERFVEMFSLHERTELRRAIHSLKGKSA